ncbi:MAG: hypothetical protein OXE82_00655 [Rhodobacter sp.]|nr:hypothetical protein [Rhodobacter sp.]
MNFAVSKEWSLPVCAVAAMAALWLGGLAIGRMNEMRNLAGLDLQPRQDVAVILAFEPERFHIEAFQDVGRYQGWRSDRAVIMAADASALRRLARNYWISGIEPVDSAQ